MIYILHIVEVMNSIGVTACFCTHNLCIPFMITIPSLQIQLLLLLNFIYYHSL